MNDDLANPALPREPCAARLPFIDIAKGVGILLIVLWHNHIFLTQLKDAANVLTAFIVPLFFFLSGVTYSPGRKTLAQLLVANADAWLKPVLVVTVLVGLAGIAAGTSTAQHLLLALTYATGFTLYWPALWFLPHLWLVSGFCAALLMVGGRWLNTGTRKAMLLVVMAVLGFYALQLFDSPRNNPECLPRTAFSWTLTDCGLPFSADLLLITGFFFLCGHFLAARVKQFAVNRRSAVLALLALVVLIETTLLIPQHTDLNFRTYGNPGMASVQAFCGIYLVLCLCSLLSRYRASTALFVVVGRMSLFILVFHLPMVGILIRQLPRYIGSPLLVGIISFLLPVLASAILYLICRRNRWLSALMLPRKTPRLPTPLRTFEAPSAMGKTLE